MPPSAGAGPAASPLGAAFGRLQQEQKERWRASAARQQQLEQLRGEVAAAAQALAGASPASGDGAEQARTRLAAQQAGLRAGLACLEGARRRAEDADDVAAQRAQQVTGQREELVALERREAALDAAVRALCVADSRVMRQWRQGAWRAAEHVEAHLLPRRQPLLDLAERLLDVQRRELAAFRSSATAAAAAGAGKEQAGSAAACGGGSGGGWRGAATAGAAAAAQLLDPLAHLKDGGHAAALVQAATAELQQLQPVREQWAALAAGSAAQLAELQAAAAQLQAQAQALQQDGGSAPLAQLREAAAAAKEGAALVGRVRQALSEWWTSPAVAATPWLKREIEGRWGCGLALVGLLVGQRAACLGELGVAAAAPCMPVASFFPPFALVHLCDRPRRRGQDGRRVAALPGRPAAGAEAAGGLHGARPQQQPPLSRAQPLATASRQHVKHA